MRLLTHITKCATVIALATGALGAAAPASAAPVQLYSATTTSLTNMTHQSAYTWQLNNIFLGNNTVTSAVLSFYGFFNWTSAASDPANILWLDLFDSAIAANAGNGAIGSATDNTNGSTLTISDVLDGFRFSGGTNLSTLSLVTAPGTYLGSSTNGYDSGVNGYGAAGGAFGTNAGAFGTSPTDWTLTITNSTVLAALTSYIANGNNLAIGLDSDCHFGDTSIQFQIFGTPNTGGQAAVPEPATLLLVGSGVVAAYRRRKQFSA